MKQPETTVTPADVHARYKRALAQCRETANTCRLAVQLARKYKVKGADLKKFTDELEDAERRLHKMQQDYAAFCELYPAQQRRGEGRQSQC